MNPEEWRTVHQLRQGGTPIKQIASQLGMARNTVRRALSMEAAPDDHRSQRGSVIDAVDGQIRALIAVEPAIGIAEIGRRIGWTRSRTPLARRVRQIREEFGSAPSVRSARKTEEFSAPSYATRFIGRRSELREFRKRLGLHRLVTITGPGGIGKTRLMMQGVADCRSAFPDGACVVELAALSNPELVPQALADALGVSGRSSHDAPTESVLMEYLKNRHMLIALDNCEHLLGACAELIGQLISSTSKLVIAVTSREVMGLSGEYVFALAPLPISDQHSGSGGAVELFVDRAVAILSDFEITSENERSVLRICERLDGLPLAIELASARLRVLSVNDLADRLDDKYRILTTGNRNAPARHSSLVATMDWSYDLCTTAQQTLWSRVAVFAGGFDLTMTEEVCSDGDLQPDEILDTLSALVAKSLLVREDHNGAVRFRMLETIREYGLGRLGPDEIDVLRQRHLRWCSSLLTKTAKCWFGSDQRVYSSRVRANHDNLRAAFQHALSANTDVCRQLAVDMLSRAVFLWACGFSVREHRMWLERTLAVTPEASTSRGRMLTVLGLVRTIQGDRGAADIALAKAQPIVTERGDEIAEALVLNARGLNNFFAGDFASAEVQLLQASEIYRAGRDVPEFAGMLDVHLGFLYSFVGDTELAATHFMNVRDKASAAGEYWLRSYAVWGLGLIALLENKPELALILGSESLGLQSVVGDGVGTTLVVDLLGWAEAAGGSPERAAVLFGAASSGWASVGSQLYGSSHWVNKRASFERKARGALGDDRFNASYERGAAMSVNELIWYASREPVASLTQDADAVGQLQSLTRREREVLSHVSAGLSNKEIAAKLTLSPRTVEGHLDHIRNKLGVRRRTEMIALLSDSKLQP